MDLAENETNVLYQALVQRNTEQPGENCIHQFFEQQVERTPQALALRFAETSLSYQELNCLANQLAHYLRALGVGPEMLVGICLDRSIEMIVAVLGILKAGGACVSLDPTYPRDRLTFMLHDTQVSLLITQQYLAEQFNDNACRKICLDRDQPLIAQQATHNPTQIGLPENLAYVIYTSGSTGRPKGVLITHQGVMNHCIAVAQQYQLRPEDRVLQFASFNFDVAFEELFPSWFCGAAVVMRSAGEMLGLLDFLTWIKQERLTVLNLPTAYWHAWVAELSHTPELLPPSTLRLLIVGGEQMQFEKLKLWQQAVGNTISFYNAYGPTETTITVTLQDIHAVDQETIDNMSVPIGRPLVNTQAYILDAQMHQVPIGVTGELYIAGSSLARGYLHHPDATAERFLPHPFATEPGLRLYRTGDLARFLPDGAVEFLGRIDQQIKIRGYRIEAGEIESVLRRHPLVRDVVVMAQEENHSEKRLVAYLLPAQAHHQLEHTDLRPFLSEHVPAYMVPAFFFWLEMFPLTPNGKIDRRALPTPQWNRPALSEAFVEPQNPLQEMLARIWAEVLGIQHIGLTDHFFDLGGNSLAAIRIISRVRTVLHKELSLQSFFRASTLREQAELLASMDSEQADLSAFPRVSRGEPLPLSFAQESVWFIQQLASDNSAYSAPAVIRLTGRIDIPLLERSINELTKRHEVLRTTFPAIQGRPVQLIHPFQWVDLPVINFQALSATEKESASQRFIQAEIRRAFTVTQLPLIRWTLLQIAPQEAILVLVEHHFVHDGWSTNMLLGELTTFYTAFLSGTRPSLPELSVQFADFATWQHQWIQGESARKQREYWQKQLAGCPPLLELPTDWPRPPVQHLRGSSQRMQISSSQYALIKAFCQKEKVTLFMMLLTIFFALLHRYSGQSDICIGSGMANRRRRELEHVAGMVINAVALRVDLAGNPAFQELLRRVCNVALGAYAHQEFPFEKVVEALQVERNLSYNPLFQVIFGIHDAPLTNLELPGVHLDLLEAPGNGSAKFDLGIIVIPRPETENGWDAEMGSEGITMIWEYNTDLFHASTIERMMGHYQALLTAVLADPQQRLADVSFLSQAQQQQMVVEWNVTQTNYSADQCIHQLFEAQAARTPEASALFFDGTLYTYKQLNQQANQLSHYLRSLGVCVGDLVGLYVGRSADLIVATLAILKTGAAYVPLDLAYPRERVAFMIQDTQMQVLLTRQSLQEQLPQVGVRIVALDEEHARIASEPQSNLPCEVQPQNMAYVIYTSGSTGLPKGVVVPHQAISRLVCVPNYVQIEPTDRMAQISNTSFDAATFEIWGALLNGAQLVGVPGDIILSPHKLAAFWHTEQITISFLTAALFNQIVQEVPDAFRNMHYLLVGGEALDPHWIRQALKAGPPKHLLNGYGPTENTTFSTYYPLKAVPEAALNIPIGYPVANSEAYVLDERMQLVPIGVPGDLYLGGDGLAQNYLHQPALTAERFVPHPFSLKHGARLYKTGDRARYLADGALEFLGRFDSQVKIRGFRIEMGEIEFQLRQHPDVREALVVLHQDFLGNKRLIAYVIPHVGQQPVSASLRAFLQEQLPEYMVPVQFMLLEQLPLTPNGKVDRRALPAPDREQALQETSFVPPRNAIEKDLAHIWSEVLGSTKVGIHDNFFALGGHSLLATQVISRANDALAVNLPLQTLFEKPTVAGLAVAVVQNQAWQIGSEQLAMFLRQLDQPSGENVE